MHRYIVKLANAYIEILTWGKRNGAEHSMITRTVDYKYVVWC